MEGQTEFQTALKKTVVMFKTLTGKELTEAEGSIFINLLDMTEGYLSPDVAQVATADKWPAETLADLAKTGPLRTGQRWPNMIPQHLVNYGVAGMVVSVGEAGNISAAPVTAEQIYSVKESETSGSSCNATGAESGRNDNSEAKALVKLVDSALNDPQHTHPVPRDKKSGLAGYADYEYIAQPITTSERDHIQGYDWQIVVLSREKDPRDSYVVHFAYQPTQEQFEEHFAKFVARTHYVHVNEWHRGDREWVGITNIKYETERLLKPEHNPRWEQADMAYRVRYYDRETGQLTFKYMPRKPSGNELATYHHLKGFAVVQSKVA